MFARVFLTAQSVRQRTDNPRVVTANNTLIVACKTPLGAVKRPPSTVVKTLTIHLPSKHGIRDTIQFLRTCSNALPSYRTRGHAGGRHRYWNFSSVEGGGVCRSEKRHEQGSAREFDTTELTYHRGKWIILEVLEEQPLQLGQFFDHVDVSLLKFSRSLP